MRAEDFDSVPGHGAIATVDGRRVAVDNRRLMEREKIDLGSLADRRQQLAENGRTAVAALRALDIEVVMLTGDNEATASAAPTHLPADATSPSLATAPLVESGPAQ